MGDLGQFRSDVRHRDYVHVVTRIFLWILIVASIVFLFASFVSARVLIDGRDFFDLGGSGTTYINNSYYSNQSYDDSIIQNRITAVNNSLSNYYLDSNPDGFITSSALSPYMLITDQRYNDSGAITYLASTSLRNFGNQTLFGSLTIDGDLTADNLCYSNGSGCIAVSNETLNLSGTANSIAGFNSSGIFESKNMFMNDLTGQLLVGNNVVFPSSNAGVIYSSNVSNRGSFRVQQFGNNSGVAGFVGFKSRGADVNTLASVQNGDVLWRGTAMGVTGSGTVPLSGFLSVIAQNVSSSWITTDFELMLIDGGPSNGNQAVLLKTEGAKRMTTISDTLKLNPVAVAPHNGTETEGEIYYNSITHNLNLWNGTDWKVLG